MNVMETSTSLRSWGVYRPWRRTAVRAGRLCVTRKSRRPGEIRTRSVFLLDRGRARALRTWLSDLYARRGGA